MATTSPNREQPAAVVFDCDGVLLESVEIKNNAFRQLFADHPQQLDAIERHHQQHLGISRYEKFRWIYHELLECELDAAESAELGRRFEEIVGRAMQECPEVPGTAIALAELTRLGIPLFVASGTPQGELEAILEARSWGHHFAEIHGSPRKKPEILNSIARLLETPPGQLLFVGDGESDHQAALETGVRFVLRETPAQRERFIDYAGPRVADLEQFAHRLREL